MAVRINALLVYSQKGPLSELEQLLDGHGIATMRVRNCAEATTALGRHRMPDLIFTEANLTDGTWDEVEALAERMSPPVPVVVVSHNVDVTLYLDAMERGVSDFIVPPFQDVDLDYVVTGAVLSRAQTASERLRGTVRKMSEVGQNVEDYARTRVRTFHPQSGRQAHGPVGERAGAKLE